LLHLDILGGIENEFGFNQCDVRDEEAQQRLSEDAALWLSVIASLDVATISG
jgi:hypothetical protein